MAAHSTERPARARRRTGGVAIGALALLSCAQPGVARPVPGGAPAYAPSHECREARDDWAEAALAARAPLDGLAECLDAGVPPCATDIAAVRSALAELTVHEQRIRALCEAPR